MCRGPPKDSNLFSGWSGSHPPKKKTGFKLLSRLAMVKTWHMGYGHPSHIGNPRLLMGGWSSSPGSMAVVVLWGRCRAVRHSKQPAPSACQTAPGIVFLETMTMMISGWEGGKMHTMENEWPQEVKFEAQKQYFLIVSPCTFMLSPLIYSCDLTWTCCMITG